MRKKALLILAIMATALIASASAAHATPSKSSACSQCHSGSAVGVTAALQSNNGTSATYKVTASTGDYLAAFNGSTRIAGVSGTTGTFTVPVGSTYTIYSVRGPGTNDGIGSVKVTPTAPVVDVTAPITTSDVKASYAGTATVHLTATDNSGGSGIATTYYKLDSAPAATIGTSVVASTLGTHTVQFWSVDKAGNIEAAKSATFVVGVGLPKATVTTPYAPSTVKRYTKFRSHGTLKPHHDAGTYAVSLAFYKKVNGSWVWKKTVNAKVSDTSTYSAYSAYVTLSGTGAWRVRAVHSCADHSKSFSSYRYLTVVR